MKDGGPAFPTDARLNDTFSHLDQRLYQGMSLRDYFAGQALAWCVAEFGGNADDMTQPAEAAYQIADAMLDEREKDTPGSPAVVR